jgi:hypothetical protein
VATRRPGAFPGAGGRLSTAGLYLPHPVSPLDRPAHPAAPIEPGVDQLVDGAFRAGGGDWLALLLALAVAHDGVPIVPNDQWGRLPVCQGVLKTVRAIENQAMMIRNKALTFAGIVKTLRLSRVVILMLGAALTAPASAAPFVSAAGGNIFLMDGVGHSKQLTYTGHDAEPVLSPDGQWVIFVRTIPGKPIPTGSDYRGHPTELWQTDANGRNATLLVRCHVSEKMETVIAGFGQIQFSSGGWF